jgi:lysine 6-dehydrogenase
MAYTLQGKIKDGLSQKTVRHQGHIDGMETLKACGLLSWEPVDVDGQKVIPRRVLELLLDERMKLGDEKDATLLRVTVQGTQDEKAVSHVFEMVDYYDSEKDYTSMAKTTSFPASIAAQMLVSGKITQRGVLFPENVFDDELYEPFIQELAARGVIISHEVK